MKNIKHLPIGFLSLMLIVTFSIGANNSFDISEVKSIQIESKVNQMSYNELISTKNSLLNEQKSLNATQNTTQSPSAKKASGNRLKEIMQNFHKYKKQLLQLLVLPQFHHLLVTMDIMIMFHLLLP
jgi:hypothetical protein